MQISKWFQKKPKIEGEIGYFALSDWWLETFTKEERKYIEDSYKPFRIGSGASNARPLTQGKIIRSRASACALLSAIPAWLKNPDDLHLNRKFFLKAEQIGSDDILDYHFLYLQMIKTFYRHRNATPEALNEAINACKKQIGIAPKSVAAFKNSEIFNKVPEHTGYKQLSIIYEKQGKVQEALNLAKQAQRQGWDGDWEKRITRLQKKLR